MQHYATLCHVVGAQDRVRQIFSSKSEIPLYHGSWSQDISDALFVTLFQIVSLLNLLRLLPIIKSIFVGTFFGGPSCCFLVNLGIGSSLKPVVAAQSLKLPGY